MRKLQGIRQGRREGRREEERVERYGRSNVFEGSVE